MTHWGVFADVRLVLDPGLEAKEWITRVRASSWVCRLGTAP